MGTVHQSESAASSRVREPPLGIPTGDKLALLIALLVSTFLTALDSLVVSTLMPKMTADLGDVSHYSAVFSAYLLAMTASMPIYGRLADVVGRKPVYATGMLLFLIGSLLCGATGSMLQLVLFRLIQGLGAGSLMPITQTMAGDAFPLRQRARLQGVFSTVWALASVAGPLVGAAMVAVATWRWVFYINIPIGVLALFLVFRNLQERLPDTHPPFDLPGAVSLLAAISLGGYVLTEHPGGGVLITILLATVAACIIFVLVELRSKVPLLSVSLFRNRVLAASYCGAMTLGGLVIGATAFMPPFIQGVLGGSVLVAGLIVTAINLIWPVGTFSAGRLVLAAGYRVTGAIGALLTLIGSGLLLVLGPDVPIAVFLLVGAVFGIGFGFYSVTVMVSVQSAVPWAMRGAATSLSLFFRTAGGIIALSLMGLVFTARLSAGFAARGLSGVDESTVFRQATSASAAAGEPGILFAALHEAYFVALGLAIFGLACCLLMPAGSAEKHAYEAPPQPAVAPELETVA